MTAFWHGWSKDQLRNYEIDPTGYWCGLTNEQLSEYSVLPDIYYKSIALNKNAKKSCKLDNSTDKIKKDSKEHNNSCDCLLHRDKKLSSDKLSSKLKDKNNTNISNKDDNIISMNSEIDTKFVENPMIDFTANEVIDEDMFRLNILLNLMI